MRGRIMTTIVAPLITVTFLVALYMIAPKIVGYKTK